MRRKSIRAGIGVTTGLAMLLSGAILFMPAAPAAVPQSDREDPVQKEMREHMLKEANKKRQADLKNDTDRLFALATELKTAVDKTNENMLSLDVVRKADEVEKLAKKVKEKMKEAIGPTQTDEPPVRPPRPFSR